MCHVCHKVTILAQKTLTQLTSGNYIQNRQKVKQLLKIDGFGVHT